MADWGVVATQIRHIQGLPEQDDNRLYLALGGVVAGGETDVALNYDNQYAVHRQSAVLSMAPCRQ
jgi:hypothetical protein